MIVVTGGAGFIGANIVAALNARGRNDILVVDNVTNTDKLKNLYDLSIADYMDKHAFNELMQSGKSFDKVEAIFHQGACSDTMISDGQYVMQNNYEYSKNALNFCRQHKARFIYASSASVYGGGDTFIESPEYESALNAYAWSKFMFDNHVRRCNELPNQCVGLRYFNVYGPREGHKQRMASVAWHFYHQYKQNQQVKLFSGTGGYQDGQQVRDFIHVDDAVAVNMYFFDNPTVSGIYNVGTGRCQSFNEVALAVINSFNTIENKPAITLQDAIATNQINYVPLPDSLAGKYQSYTQANLDKLIAAGYQGSFSSVEQGVEKYMKILFANETE